jgi:tetratricopeptide (TPR) repeat protein
MPIRPTWIRHRSISRKPWVINRNHGPSLYFLGKIMALRGNFDGAIKETEKAVAATPGNVLAHAQLGELYRQRQTG